MSIHRKLTTGCAVAVLAFGLAACGSSDDDDTPTAMMPMGTPVAFADLQMGETVPPGTYAVSDASAEFLAAIEDFELPEGGYAAGAMESVGGLDFTCDADSAANCNVVVNEDGSITTTGTIMVAMTPPPLPPLESATMAAVTAASYAADAAQTAADAAMTAADEARTAAADRAQFQTRFRSSQSRNAATAAYEAAKKHAAAAATAAQEAADAEDVTAAIEARVRAEDAQKEAETAQTDAEDARDQAVARAANEVHIVGTKKSVGGTTIDAAAGSLMTTTNDVRVVTGLLDDNDGNEQTKYTAPVQGGTPATAKTATADYVAPEASVGAFDLTIGKLLDSPDDSARLLLITHYAGSKNVKLYAIDATPTEVTFRRDKDDGKLYQLTGDTPAVAATSLTLVGTYYKATSADAMLDNPMPLDEEGAIEGDHVTSTSKPKQVYSYSTGPGTDTIMDTDDDPRAYVVLNRTITGANTDGVYNPVNIHIEFDRDGNTDMNTDTDNVEVAASIPEATAYKHMHFGVWAALNDANEDTGAQTIDGLGIGFVNATADGEGLNLNLPTFGDASYRGNWVATIQEADPDGNGDVALVTDAASMTANFGTGKVGITLTNLATLTAEIDHSRGIFVDNTTAPVMDAGDPHGLSSEGEFMGHVAGGFYGDKMDEAGGVFRYFSEGNEDGAFHGAFGGDAREDKSDD